MLENFRKNIAKFISPVKNAMSLPKQFLRYGSERMFGNWADVVMNDADSYTGYGYGTIRNRANKVARTATERIRTLSKKKEDYTHPYIDIISKSKTFSNYNFWKDISIFLDLEGVYYLMAVRAVGKAENGSRRVGKIQEFKMLNPYNVRRILSPDGLEVAGYQENRKGMVRDIPKEMIIEIRDLNPFDEDNPFSMTDAAKDGQFTLKTAGDYTRHALRNNINAPGILSTDVVLEDKEFENFMQRVLKHKKGEPIFGNGSGAIKWESMNVELSKSALKDVNDISRDLLFAVSGESKTTMGIEQSGVTRDTAKVMKDLNMENHILPQIQLIIDALNQDYKNNYPQEFERDEATMVVENPNATDHDADIKVNELKSKDFELYNDLINKGYKADLAAQYVMGQITIEQLGEPTEEPKNIPVDGGNDEKPSTGENAWKSKKGRKKKDNEFKPELNQSEYNLGLVQSQQGALQNAVSIVEQKLSSYVINKVRNKRFKNDIDEEWGSMFDSESNLIPQSEKNDLKGELGIILTAFYGVIVNLEGSRIMNDRVGEFAMKGLFKLDSLARKYIKEISKKVSESHIDTISNELYETARKAALEGKSQEQIINELKTKYTELSENSAKRVSRTETNRAFTRAQYEADRQFIDQNNLQGKVYKQWRTRSANPCPFCEALQAEGPIPFESDFRGLGESITVGKGKDRKSLKIGFEALQAGNAHPNCSCDYLLIIKD